MLFHSDDGPQRVRRGEDDEASRRRRSTLLLLLGTPPVSAVMQCVPDAGEDPFADVKELIADVLNKLQSEASSEANAGEDPFSKVKELITDLINKLQSGATSEANHKSYRDDEFAKDSEKTTDLETQVATHSSKLEAAVSTSGVSDGEVPELQGDLGTLFAHELKTDATSADERKIFCHDQGGSRARRQSHHREHSDQPSSSREHRRLGW